ncbi:hypothetical protein M378DRAFT_866439 [Amanita muscaria Koide BX008]|uniref:Uncharacterized protein n=1 Tax=Amanita muscaria (strain Koide BX008) TaxID=946122 RepID=A0A0C2T3N5_AMAMK|nr:hypothetical protein M378DRAFT_866439 [Amanita muscaria Koide BX008]
MDQGLGRKKKYCKKERTRQAKSFKKLVHSLHLIPQQCHRINKKGQKNSEYQIRIRTNPIYVHISIHASSRPWMNLENLVLHSLARAHIPTVQVMHMEECCDATRRSLHQIRLTLGAIMSVITS